MGFSRAQPHQCMDRAGLGVLLVFIFRNARKEARMRTASFRSGCGCTDMQIKSEMRPEVCASLGLLTRVTVINEHVTKPKVKPDEELLTLTCKWKIERMEPDKTDCLGHSFVNGERHQHFGPCLHPGQGIYMSRGWLRQWEMRESRVSEVRGSGGIRSLFWGQFASRTQEALVQAGL